ncbi:MULTISPECIES: hypothetical protein [Ramlibacter]|uniref:STAS/SEC14 domain-containing protein n=1 Tax=Ramlibacter aquaticus TaxID=2780094 RepID=A0ABR9SI89_9BURK|nr:MULTISPECIES: hypothetical protein [Ramlibacter]MBE7942086.1 hypothetical protein [Ramlibacter aquaticus]
MNLVVAARHEGPLVRFHVEGRWQSGDALKLAYFIKAAASRVRGDQLLIDLTGVRTPPGVQEKFLICDRLRRALTPKMRVGLVTPEDLVDGSELPAPLVGCPDIALFPAEPEARAWLRHA